MGYTTDFDGTLQLNKPLQPKIKKFLELLNETRRMARNCDLAFGIQGEFYVFDTNAFNYEANVINQNQEPSTQPGLWCQWVPNHDGTAIEWDEGEKFYNYTEWLVYIIEKILKPNGYVLNGKVKWYGEERTDVGTIKVINNEVYIKKELITAPESMRTDVFLILEEDGRELQPVALLRLPESTTKEAEPEDLRIQITGSGTAAELASALRQVANDIELGNYVNDLSDKGKTTWEDSSILTVITKD